MMGLHELLGVLSLALLVVVCGAACTVGYIRWLVKRTRRSPCSECGSSGTVVVATDVESERDRALLVKAACTACGRELFYPDPAAEKIRAFCGDGYRPSWFLTEDGRLVQRGTHEWDVLYWRSVTGKFISARL